MQRYGSGTLPGYNVFIGFFIPEVEDFFTENSL